MHENTSVVNFPRSRDWAARWIWHPQASERNAWVLFRSEFDIDFPGHARLFISADTRYRVWVNGTLLAEVVDSQGMTRGATGPDWRAMMGNAWRSDTHFTGGNKIGPFQEQVDLRALPVGWKEAGFDASVWQTPAVISDRGSDSGAPVMPWCRMVPRDIELTEWQALGFDRNSVFVDPLFVDPANNDYRVQPESLALQVGFKNFEINTWGLTREFPGIW